ncbi:UNVERIFIED_CONTAM: hypothetical protein Sangu_1507000 [Sesamum angustifolium]|uniref:Embryo defective 2735 n=1 Tax=Sesamum angustifolium TaxID=2727405 RepID=A0AAW2MRP7_9LAMI
MKFRVVCSKVYDYVRYDLKEIAFPSSLPDPPHIEKRRKLSWKERFLVLKEASRLYAASWVRDIGPELRPYDYKKQEQSEDKSNEEKTATKEREPTTLEDLAVAARGNGNIKASIAACLHELELLAYLECSQKFY